MVAKQTDQIGRREDGSFVSDDRATFDKVSQEVNSCRDLIKALARKKDQPRVKAVIPLLVVPDNSLWQVDYSSDGVVEGDPHEVTHASLFSDSEWSAEGPLLGNAISHRLSHLEFATFGALREVISSYFGTDGFFYGPDGFVDQAN